MREFVKVDRDQMLLLPPSVDELLPADHLARFVVEVVEQLDLSAIIARYSPGKKGYAPYHPAMMTALLFYGYATGVFSSRKIERGCRFDLAFRFIAAGHTPDHDTISKFRRANLAELSALFVSILVLAREMGFLKVGSVALDGTKIKANASKHAAVSYKRAKEIEEKLRAEVRRLMKLAEESDNAPIAEGIDIPAEIARREDRIRKLQEAREIIETRKKIAEATERIEALEDHAEEFSQACDKIADGDCSTGLPEMPECPEPEPPEDKAQHNFTDPDSRIMLDKGAFTQAYNAQAAVDTASMIIVHNHLSQATNDKRELLPGAAGIDTIYAVLFDRTPEAIIADSGYFSASNLRNLPTTTDAYIAPGRTKHNLPLDKLLAPPATGVGQENWTPAQKMRHKLDTEKGRAIYRLRKMTVEPAIGIIKSANGLRQFLLRGVENVRHEWSLACIGYNLKRMFNLMRSKPA